MDYEPSAEYLGSSGTFCLNMDRINSSNMVPAFLKEIARNISESKGGCFLFGRWLKNASWIDVENLDRLCDSILVGKDKYAPSKEEADNIAACAMLAVALFSTGEGLETSSDNIDGLSKRLSLIKSYIIADTMRRKGVPVRLFYENMSLDEDINESNNRPIIEFMGPEDLKG